MKNSREGNINGKFIMVRLEFFKVVPENNAAVACRSYQILI